MTDKEYEIIDKYFTIHSMGDVVYLNATTPMGFEMYIVYHKDTAIEKCLTNYMDNFNIEQRKNEIIDDIEEYLHMVSNTIVELRGV